MSSIAPGIYFAKLRDCGTAESKKGAPYFFVDMEVTHIANGGDWVELASPLRRDIQFYLTDNALEISLAQMRQLGFNNDLKRPDVDPAIKANGFEVECFIEEYEGKARDKWRLPRKAIDRNKMDAKKLDVLAAKVKQMAGVRTETAPRPTAPPVSRAPQVDEVLPFEDETF